MAREPDAIDQRFVWVSIWVELIRHCLSLTLSVAVALGINTPPLLVVLGIKTWLLFYTLCSNENTGYMVCAEARIQNNLWC